MKGFMNKLFIFAVLIHATTVSAQIEVKYLNERFTWIKVPSKYVQAGLNNPIDGQSICWIKVNTKKEFFSFVFRRALPYASCLEYVSRLRDFLKKNEEVEVIGNMGSKEKKGNYSAMWELMRGETGCEGYFAECDKFEKKYQEWDDWKKNPINKALYP
jgi:hypothetical protein